ncbi:MAG: aspartate aminotransferase family protein [Bryobacterales bacterium]
MDGEFWRGGFGPLLPETAVVPFGDLDALEHHLRGGKYAAFFVEPVQGEAGIRIPPDGYLQAAQALCRKHGTLFVADEVQTGLYRTGRFLASHHFGLEPDIVILAKALSGGLVPSGAVLMSDVIYKSVFSSLKRAIVHTSTYSENAMSMRAGLAVLDVLENENLGDRALASGEYLRERLRQELEPYEMAGEVRGLGLLNGIEFQAPHRLALRASFEAFRRIHPAMFGQIVVMRLFRDHGVLTQICGNDFMVLKAAPPLVASREQLDKFVDSLRSVVELMHTGTAFWTDALGLARRVSGI